MNLKVLFLMILLAIFCFCLFSLVYSFFKKENLNKKTKYTYIIFYKNGKKVTNSFSLTDEENKEFNDFLNKSPFVSSYNVREVLNDKRC